MKTTVANRCCGLLLALAPALNVLAAGAPGVLEGRLTRVTASFVQLDHNQTFIFNPAVAQCFDFRGDAMPCETLVAIGLRGSRAGHRARRERPANRNHRAATVVRGCT